MQKAFNRKMLVKMVRVVQLKGFYNADNDYVEGSTYKEVFYGVNIVGNRFAQFEEGIARDSTVGGERFSDYRTIHVSIKFPEMNMGDHVIFRGTTYNILQMSDEQHYNFSSYIIEKIKSGKEGGQR